MNMKLPRYDPANNVVYTDAYLNRWSDVYVEQRIRDYGIELTYFLVAPERILEWIELKRLQPISEIVGEHTLRGVRDFIGRRAVERAVNGEPIIVHPKARH